MSNSILEKKTSKIKVQKLLIVLLMIDISFVTC